MTTATGKKTTVKNLTLTEKRENLEPRILKVIEGLLSKTDKQVVSEIKWNEPNSKVYAKNWLIPSINLKLAFIHAVNNNPELLESDRVKVLYDFFKDNDICTNCDDCTGYCYNWKAYRYVSTLKGRFYRMYQLLAHMDEVEKRLTKQCKEGQVYREHIEGDIYSDEYFEMLIRIAENNPKSMFYTYTKHYDRVERYASRIPANFQIAISYDENNNNVEQIKRLNGQGNKIFYTSNKDKENKPVYNNLDLFPHSDKTVNCLGKCEICMNCTQGDNRIIKCDIH